MHTRRARVPVTMVASVVVGLLVAGSASAAVSAAITKSDYVAKADAICEAGNAKINNAAAKLGDNPTDKQVKAFVVGTLVPNVAGQIAKIQKLGYPAGDRAQLVGIFTAGTAVLAKIKKDPSLATGNDDPFATVDAQLQAYGFQTCGAGSSSDEPLDTANSFAGHYTGTWKNTTFGSTGTIDITITPNASNRTVEVKTTITGNVFGAAAPAPETLTVPLDATDPSKPVTVTSPTFGQLTVSLQPDGSLVSESTDVPGSSVNTFKLTLKPSATGIDGSYTVGLASGSTANGTVTLTKA